MPKVKKPEIPLHSMFFTLFMSWLAAFNYLTDNLIGFVMDLIIISGFVLSQLFLKYIPERRIYKHIKLLERYENVITTPKFSEEGESTILTFVMPSQKLLNELKKFDRVPKEAFDLERKHVK